MGSFGRNNCRRPSSFFQLIGEYELILVLSEKGYILQGLNNGRTFPVSSLCVHGPQGNFVHISFLDKETRQSCFFFIFYHADDNRKNRPVTACSCGILRASNAARSHSFMLRNRAITLISFQQKQITFGCEN